MSLAAYFRFVFFHNGSAVTRTLPAQAARYGGLWGTAAPPRSQIRSSSLGPDAINNRWLDFLLLFSRRRERRAGRPVGRYYVSADDTGDERRRAANTRRTRANMANAEPTLRTILTL